MTISTGDGPIDKDSHVDRQTWVGPQTTATTSGGGVGGFDAPVSPR